MKKIMQVEDILLKFFRAHQISGGRYLLACSGGPDSKALLYALLQIKKNISFELHVVHVDHGWRKSSTIEADLLEKEVVKLGLTFHRKTLSMKETKDLENVAREERTSYFSKLYQKLSIDGLFLAHHKGDLIETTLKRAFEGAHLVSLKGISEKSLFRGMLYLRPFLELSKDAIYNYLLDKGLSYVEDETNSDPRFLRARMRESILPYLEEKFGKKIENNLYLLSKRSLELKEYFDEKVEPYLKKKLQGPYGMALKLPDLTRVEMRHLILRLAKEEGVELSRELLEKLLDHIEKKHSNKRFILEKEILLYRGYLFFLNGRRFSIPEGEISLGVTAFEGGRLIAQPVQVGVNSSWIDFFQGRWSKRVAASKKIVCLPLDQKLKKKRSKEHIPPFLRDQIPYLENTLESSECKEQFNQISVMLNGKNEDLHGDGSF